MVKSHYSAKEKANSRVYDVFKLWMRFLNDSLFYSNIYSIVGEIE